MSSCLRNLYFVVGCRKCVCLGGIVRVAEKHVIGKKICARAPFINQHKYTTCVKSYIEQ